MLQTIKEILSLIGFLVGVHFVTNTELVHLFVFLVDDRFCFVDLVFELVDNFIFLATERTISGLGLQLDYEALVLLFKIRNLILEDLDFSFQSIFL